MGELAAHKGAPTIEEDYLETGGGDVRQREVVACAHVHGSYVNRRGVVEGVSEADRKGADGVQRT